MRIGRLARREHTGDAGLHLHIRLDVTARIHLQLSCEELRVGRVADEDENAVRLEDGLLAGLGILQPHGLHLACAEDLSHNRIPDETDLRMILRALLQDRACAQFVAAVDNCDGCGIAREEESLLQRAVPAADHDHLFILEERPVAGGAVRDAAPEQSVLARHVQVDGVGACRHDQRIGLVRARVALDFERTRRQVNFVRRVEFDARPEAFRLLLEQLAQLRPTHALRKTGIVLDGVGQRGLPAQLRAGQQHRGEFRARRVQRRG